MNTELRAHPIRIPILHRDPRIAPTVSPQLRETHTLANRPIETPILHRLGDMRRLDGGTLRKIRNGPRDLRTR